MKTTQNRQIKKLTHHLNYLKEELIDVEEIFDSARSEINLAVMEYFSKVNKRIPLAQAPQQENSPQGDTQAQQTEDEAAHPASPELKKLFRKIAIETHPDKLDESDEDYDFKKEKYIEAAEAIKNNNHEKLIEIAIELDLEVDIDFEQQLGLMTKSIKNLEKKIDSTKKTAQYVWGTCKDEAVKREILNRALHNLGIQAITQEIDDVLTWLKNDTAGGTSYKSRDPNRPANVDTWRPGTKPPKRKIRR